MRFEQAVAGSEMRAHETERRNTRMICNLTGSLVSILRSEGLKMYRERHSQWKVKGWLLLNCIKLNVYRALSMTFNRDVLP